MRYGMSYSVCGSSDPQPRAPRVLPERALVISQVEGTSRSILSVHNIRDMQLDGGRVVDHTAIPEIVGSLGLLGGLTWCDDSILACGASGVVWYRKACVRPMTWVLNGHRVTRRVRWPTLVFRMGFAGTFHVWATAESRRPTAATALYHAPLGNIFADARMCWGNVPVPAYTMAALPDFESAVYDTAFTHANHPGVLAGGGDLYQAWRKAGAKGLSKGQMSPFKRTLESIFNEP